MKEGWKEKKIGELCDIYNGSTPLRREKNFWEDGTINWFTINDIRNQGREINYTKQKITEEGFKCSSLKLIPVNSILLCCTASIGEFATNNIELTTNQQFNGLVIKNQEILYPRYLFHFAATLKSKLLEVSGKTTIDFISITKVKKLNIPIPPLQEQHQIVQTLDKAFAKIDRATANIEQNIKNAEELFQSKLDQVFGQKGEGAGPSLSKGWEERKLGEVVKYDKTKYIGNKRPYVGLEHIESNTGKFIGNLEPSKVKSSTFQFDSRHILYGRLRPYLNKVLVPNFEGHCSTEIFPILPKNGLNRSFLSYWLLNPKTVSKIEATSTGARMPRANMNEVIKFDILMPPMEIQEEISENLTFLKERLEGIISQYSEKLKNLEHLKKSLLEKAFAGELAKESEGLKTAETTFD